MPNLMVFISNLDVAPDGFHLAAIAYVEPDSPAIGVDAAIPWTATANQINAAMIDAAVIAAAASGYIVLPGDKKILICGAV